jgi:O-methyltransferase
VLLEPFATMIFLQSSGCMNQKGMYLLLTLMIESLSVEGAFAELGTFEGTTAAFMQMVLDYHNSDKELFLYDSFEGLPAKRPEDMHPLGVGFQQGSMKTSLDKVIAEFNRHKLKLPKITKGFFKDTLHTLPDKLSFVHFDGDFYDSTIDCLKYVYPRLSRGGIIALHDYGAMVDVPLPGVKKACDEFFADKPESVVPGWHADNCHGVVRKL